VSYIHPGRHVTQVVGGVEIIRCDPQGRPLFTCCRGRATCGDHVNYEAVPVDEDVPANWPVQPLAPDAPARDRVTCGACHRSWDDAIVTSMTPTPAARCPFEPFHEDEDEDD
jgi:hypothetical protein